MRALFVAIALWLASSASAAEVGRLPYGAAFQLRHCLAGEQAACDAVAGELGGGWAAFVRRGSAGGLSGEELRLYQGLTCAAGRDPAACAALGAQLLEAKRPLAGAVLTAKACAGGDAGARAILGDCPRSFEATLAAPTDDELAAVGVSRGQPPSEKALRKLASACDKRDVSACVGLARAAAVAGEGDTTEALFHDRIVALCDAQGGSACELAANLDEPDVPSVPALRGAEALLRSLCEVSGDACRLQAQLLELGSVQAWGSPASHQAWTFGCDGGAKDACSRLDAVDRDSGLLARLQARCEAAIAGHGDPRVCTVPIGATRFGVGTAKDPAAADALERRACDAGSGIACGHLADKAWDSAPADAYRDYARACEVGDVYSCGVTARILRDGEAGVAVDTATADRIARDACRKGSGYACYEQAYGIYGERVSGSDAEMFRLFGLSCSLGDVDACTGVGMFLLEGTGADADTQGGLWLLDLACREEWADACMLLGDAYLMGYDGEREGEARWAYERACDLGDEEACLTVADVDDAEPREPSPGRRPAWAGSSVPDAVARPAVEERVEPTPSRPTPSPRPKPERHEAHASTGFYVGLGSQRSWTLDNQASSLRFGVQAGRGRVAIGAHLELMSDNRWKPGQYRTYRRTTLRADVALRLFRGVELGAGGLLGGYTAHHDPPVFQLGAFESLTLDALPGEGIVGGRIEQTQYLTAAGIEHATALFMIFGGRFE